MVRPSSGVCSNANPRQFEVVFIPHGPGREALLEDAGEDAELELTGEHAVARMQWERSRLVWEGERWGERSLGPLFEGKGSLGLSPPPPHIAI